MLLAAREDIDLSTYRAVAWGGDPVEVADTALARIDDERKIMLEHIAAHPDALYYGVTTGQGDRADALMSDEERKAFESRLPALPMAFGEPFPERVVRGTILARLSTFLDGHGGVRSQVVQAIAEMLDGRPLPEVPSRGHGEPGEVVLGGHLFLSLGERVGGLEMKEPMALINGAPGGAALAADVALSGRERLETVAPVLALAAEAGLAPSEHFAEELEEMWADRHDRASLAAVRGLLEGGAGDRRPFQAPVSFRAIPRILGQLYRAQEQIELAATTALRSVADNPVWAPSDEGRGRLISSGSMHNPQILSAIDGVSFAWADTCTLVYHLVERLLYDEDALKPLRYTLGQCRMVAAGWAQDAQAAAQPTLLPLSGCLQSDTGSPYPLAWRKAQEIGTCTDAAIAVLAVLSYLAIDFHGRPVPPRLRDLVDTVDAYHRPVDEASAIGLACGELAAAYGRRAAPVGHGDQGRREA